MKNETKFKILAFRLAMICAVNIGAVITVFSGSQIHFKLVRGAMIVIPVTINGAGPYQFMLDTGSNTTLVYSEFAGQLGLRPIDRVLLVTATGSRPIPRAKLNRITIGSRSVFEVESLITDLQEIRAIDSNIVGVVGQNVLSHFNYLINYRESYLEIEDGSELESMICGARAGIDKHEGRDLVNVQIGSANSVRMRFVLDSGIASTILFEEGARKIKFVLQLGGQREVRATTDFGNRIVKQKVISLIDIGGKIIYELPVIVIDTAASQQGRIEDGLLPTIIFQTIYFNHRKNFVFLN